MVQPLMSRHFRRGNYKLHVGFVLAGAALFVPSAPAERYPDAASANPPAAEQPATGGATPGAGVGNAQNQPISAGNAPARRSPFGADSSPASNPNSNAATPPGSAASAYGRASTAGGAPPRTMPLTGSNPQPPSGFQQSRSAPANYQSPPASAAGEAASGTGRTPSALMRAMLSPPAGARLQGRPTSLQDAVAGAQNRGDQTVRVEAYWDLCSSVADYYLGLREQDELRRLRTLVHQVGQTWQQAEADLNIRVGTSQRAALASQLRLANVIGRSSSDLPLPADTPHCASYDTEFERIFQTGAPAEARELAAVLPARYAELKVAANGVTRGEQWVEDVARDDKDGTGTLRALELLALQRRAFVQIARDYNRRIARYTELAAPGQLSPAQLTSMLIFTTAPSTATRTSSPSSTQPPWNRQSNTPPSPPPTFVERSSPGLMPINAATTNADALLQTSVEQNISEPAADAGAEKSLLVPPSQQ